MSFGLTWLGNASLGLKTSGFNILVNPFLRNNPTAQADADTVEADYILVKHGHDDHIGDTIEITKRTGAIVISNAEYADGCEQKALRCTGNILAGVSHTHLDT